MTLIDADAIDINEIPCVHGTLCELEDVEQFILNQPEIDLRDQGNKIYIVMVGKYKDRHPILTTTDYAAAEKFVKVFNKNRTYYQAYIVEFNNFCPNVPENFKDYIYNIQFTPNLDYIRTVGGSDRAIEFYDNNAFCNEVYTQEAIDSLKENGYYIHLINADKPRYEVYVLYPTPYLGLIPQDEEMLVRIAEKYLVNYLNKR